MSLIRKTKHNKDNNKRTIDIGCFLETGLQCILTKYYVPPGTIRTAIIDIVLHSYDCQEYYSYSYIIYGQ